MSRKLTGPAKLSFGGKPIGEVTTGDSLCGATIATFPRRSHREGWLSRHIEVSAAREREDIGKIEAFEL